MRKPPWWFGLALGLVAGGLLLLGLALGDDDTPASDADWVAALATLLALAAALLAGWYLARGHDIESKREADRDEDAKRAQASLVAIWYDVRLDPMREFTPEPKAPTPWSLFGIWVRNASELPVFGARIDVAVDGAMLGHTSVSGEGTGRPGVVPPSRDPVFHGLGEAISAKLEELRPRSSGSIPDPPVPEITFHFTDAAGWNWVRRPDGQLFPDDSPEEG